MLQRLPSQPPIAPPQSQVKWTHWAKWTKCALLTFPFFISACRGTDTQDNQYAAAPVDGVTIKAQWGAGRDRLGLQNNRAGLISYAAEGDTNCTVRGNTTAIDGGFQIRPDGDEFCAVDVRMDKAAVV